MTIFILGTQEYATLQLQTVETDSALKKTLTKPLPNRLQMSGHYSISKRSYLLLSSDF